MTVRARGSMQNAEKKRQAADWPAFGCMSSQRVRARNLHKGDGMRTGIWFAVALTVTLANAGEAVASENNVGAAPLIEAKKAGLTKERAIGICHGVDYNPTGQEHAALLSPEYAAAGYFSLYENTRVNQPPSGNAGVVEQPTHGNVVFSKFKDGLLHPTYMPSKGYIGDDKVTFKVNVDGATVIVVYLLKVTDMFTDGEGVHDLLCKETGTQWKISPPNHN